MVQLKLFPTPATKINLIEFDLVVINSSGGKDSVCSIYEVCRLAKEQKYDREKIVISHQDLGEADWEGVPQLVKEQADRFGLKAHFSKRRDKNGKEESMLEYAQRRGKWASNKQRWCTSDFKSAPGDRVLRMLTKDMGKCRILYVFGFRKDESPRRNKKQPFELNEKLSTKNRQVFNWLPIHDWTTEEVWQTIKTNNLPYHYAYKLGMPRF